MDSSIKCFGCENKFFGKIILSGGGGGGGGGVTHYSVTDSEMGGDLLGSVCLGVSKYLQPITRLVRRKKSVG